MFEYIFGIITAINPSYLVLEAGGIGYQIAMGNPYRYSSKLNQEARIYVHQVVREDAQLLYGFASLEEKQLFLKLISVSGIGPKSGLAIMASDDHGGLIQAIETNNAAFLTNFPGVGKKTAQQIILDLKGKLGDLAGDANETASVLQTAVNPALAEALEALVALGYGDKEIRRAEKELENLEAQTTDNYLRQALKLMMKK